jgi:FAD-linked sulfhydryl oxidase
MNDQWVRDVQHHCDQLTRSLINLRDAVLSHLPGQQQQKQQQISQNSAVSTFYNPNIADAGLSKQSKTTKTTAGSSLSSAAAAAGITKEDIGRATWLFLHTLAAQYPEKPTRQQRKDAKTLIDVLTRMYPCGECARHFKKVVAANPPQVENKREFSHWMCEIHNVVNRSLGKPSFNCDLVESRWAGLECEEEDACSLEFGGSGGAVKKRRW